MERIDIEELNNRIKNHKLVVVIFSTEWCGQCKMSKILVEKIRKKFKDVHFFEIDVDDNNLWDNENFDIKEVPTFLGFKNKERIFLESGYQTEEKLTNLLKKLSYE